jgi:tetratricopeptide (TPR) repeat protein
MLQYNRIIIRIWFILILLSCSACSVKKYSDDGASPAAPATQKTQAKDFTGYSSDRSTEAQSAFAKARVLWKKGRSKSAANLGETCADPQVALALLNKAIELDPKYGEAYVRRGMAKMALGDAEGAFDDATNGIRLWPTSEAYAERGLILLRSGEFKPARRDLEYAITADASRPQAYNYLGILGMSEERPAAENCGNFSKGCSRGDCSFLEYAKSKKICK